MMLADAHIHLFKRGFANRYGRGWARRDELAGYEALRREHEIKCALAVGFEGDPLYRDNNADLARWAAERPWIRPVGYIPPEARVPIQALERLWTQGFVGISLYCPDRGTARQVNQWGQDCVDWLNYRRAILSVNAPPPATEMLAPLVRRADGCVWLFSHLGLPGRYSTPPTIATARTRLSPLLGLASFGHVGVKLSGLYAVCSPSHLYPHLAAQPFVSLLLDSFGPGRLYWGSDYPPCLEHVSFAQSVDAISELGVTSQERHAIAAGNLLRLLS